MQIFRSLRGLSIDFISTLIYTKTVKNHYQDINNINRKAHQALIFEMRAGPDF